MHSRTSLFVERWAFKVCALSASDLKQTLLPRPDLVFVSRFPDAQGASSVRTGHNSAQGGKLIRLRLPSVASQIFPGGKAPSRSEPQCILGNSPLALSPPVLDYQLLSRQTDYDGPREAKDIIAAATSSMPTFVKRAATPAEVDALREQVRLQPGKTRLDLNPSS